MQQIAAVTVDPTRPRTPTPFAIALQRERQRHHASRYEVADACGCSQRDVERWERGEAVPSVQQFKRLVGKYRRLAATPPNYSTGTERTTLAEKALADIQRDALQTKEEPEKLPEPVSFGSGLKRIRLENKVSAATLGEIVGLVGTAIANWEADRNAPSQANLEKLYSALPELKAAVDVGAVNKPLQKRPGPAAPTLVVVKSEPVEEEPANTNATKPEPAGPEPAKPAPTLAEAATKYAEVRVAMHAAKLRFEAAAAALEAAEIAWQESKKAHLDALKALDDLAGGAV